jgi:hypothetical protein
LGAWKLARANSSNDSTPSLFASSWSKMRRAGLSAFAAPAFEDAAPVAGVPVALADPPVDDGALVPALVEAPLVPPAVLPVALPAPVAPVVEPVGVELPVDDVPVDGAVVPVAEVPPGDVVPLLPGTVADVPVDGDGSVPVEPDVDCATASELPAKSAAASAPVRSVRWNVWVMSAP